MNLHLICYLLYTAYSLYNRDVFILRLLPIRFLSEQAPHLEYRRLHSTNRRLERTCPLPGWSICQLEGYGQCSLQKTYHSSLQVRLRIAALDRCYCALEGSSWLIYSRYQQNKYPYQTCSQLREPHRGRSSILQREFQQSWLIVIHAIEAFYCQYVFGIFLLQRVF